MTTPDALRRLRLAPLILTMLIAPAEPAASERAAEQRDSGNRQRRPERRDDAPIACSGLVGTWRWFDRGTVTIGRDLRAEWRDGASNRLGHWANGACDARTGRVTLAWSNGVTDVIERPGGSSLQGRNSRGMTIWANRLSGTERRSGVTPGPRQPDRAPHDGAPRSASAPATCARTFEEVRDADELGLPPLLLADRLAEHQLPETAIPSALRGAIGAARVSTRRAPGADGLCGTVRISLGGRSRVEYRVYAPRANTPQLLQVLDEDASVPVTSRRFNDDPRKFCQFFDGRTLSIGCTWARDQPADEHLRQVVAVAQHAAAAGDMRAIEPVRQLAAAAQNHATEVANIVQRDRAAWLMSQADRPAGAAARPASAEGGAGGSRLAGYGTFVPLILGLGVLGILALMALVAIVVAVVYVRSGRRRA